MQVGTAGPLPFAGRRRVTQLSKDEWREALQQQLREKNIQKNSHAESTQQETNQEATKPRVVEHDQQREENPVGDVNVTTRTGGRRFVCAMTTDEWKVSLEEQIREKERQRQSSRQSASSDSVAVAQPCSERSTASVIAPTAERGIAPQSGDASSHHNGGRRRGPQPQQSREEYLRGLQEQIDMKKKQQETEQAVEKPRVRRGQRRLLDEEEETGLWPPLPGTNVEPKTEQTQQGENETVSDKSGAGNAAKTESSESVETTIEASAPVPTPAVVVAVDSGALAKLFELCEGMKQQNDELKQQLQQQQTVLASLGDKTAKTDEPISKKQSAVPTSKKTSSQVTAKETSIASAVPIKRKRTAAKTPTNSSRLPHKQVQARDEKESIMVSTPTPIKPNKSKGMAEGDDEAPSKTSVSASTTVSTLKVTSRLPQPRILPRLRSADTLTTSAISGSIRSTVELPTQPAEQDIGCLPVDEGPIADGCVSPHNSSTTNAEMAKDDQLFPSVGAVDQRLPLLERPSHAREVKNRVRPQSEPVSFPLLPSSSQRDTSDCLDSISSTRSTSICRSLPSPLHNGHWGSNFQNKMELEAHSLSILDGSSVMVPCTSKLPVSLG